jgi:hypothetical protein
MHKHSNNTKLHETLQLDQDAEVKAIIITGEGEKKLL